MNAQRLSVQVPGLHKQPQQINHPRRKYNDSVSEDGVITGPQPAFQTQNFLYELQSKCNNLQYEKTKSAMAFDSAMSQLQYKNNYLQQVNSTLTHQNQSLSEERDMLRTLLAEVREQNYAFSKEISQLRVQINSIISHSHLEQQGNNDSYQVDTLQTEIAKKDQIIESLQRQLLVVPKTRIESDKHLLKQMEKDNNKLRDQIEITLQHYDQSKLEAEEANKKLKQKQKEFQEEKARLQAEIDQLRSQNTAKTQKNSTIVTEQLRKLSDLVQIKQEHLRVLENDKQGFENRVNELNLEVGRLKCQKNNLEQLNEYLQSNAQENQIKRQSLQDEVFRAQKQIAELRTQLFSQKIQGKKRVSELRLQFEEERIRFIESVEQKTKELNRLREYNSQNNRQSYDIEEMSVNTHRMMTDLDKANHQIEQLRSQNEALKRQISSTEAKLQKKHQKYCSLESKIKTENQTRIKSLQAEVYRQQQLNSQLEIKIQLLRRRSPEKSQTVGNRAPLDFNKESTQNEGIRFDVLREKEQNIKQLQQKIRQLQLVKRHKDEEIFKLESELRLSRQIRQGGLNEQKISTIELLREQITSLNQEISSIRQQKDLQKRQSNFKEEKLQQKLRLAEKDKDFYLKQQNRASQKLKQMQQQLRNKDDEISSLKIEFDMFKEDIEREKKEWFKQQSKANNNNGSFSFSKDGCIPQKQQSKESMKGQRQRQEANEQSNFTTSQLYNRILALQKENVSIKMEYSNCLKQHNALLVRYQALQEKYKQATDSKVQSSADLKHYKVRVTQLQQQCQRLRQVISEQEQEQKNLIKMVHQYKQYQRAPHYHDYGTNNSSSSSRNTRLTSQNLWLDKDYKMGERDSVGSHHPHRPHYHHKI